MANHTVQEGSFPEPHTPAQYQAELVRAWGIILRLDDKTKRVLTEAKDAIESMEKVVKTVESMTAITQAVSKE